MSIIAQNLKKIMEERNLNSFSLEKKAELKVNVISSILSGRSNNPKMTTLIAISKALNLSIDQIVGIRNIKDNKDEKSSYPQKNLSKWNYHLSNKCLSLISDFCFKKNIDLSFDKVGLIHKNLYELSIKKSQKNSKGVSLTNEDIEPDEIYAEWLIENVSKNL